MSLPVPTRRPYELATLLLALPFWRAPEAEFDLQQLQACFRALAPRKQGVCVLNGQIWINVFIRAHGKKKPQHSDRFFRIGRELCLVIREARLPLSYSLPGTARVY